MNKFLPGLIAALLLTVNSTVWAEHLTLGDCLQLARQQNLSLQVESKNPQIAAEQVRETRSVFLPQVDLNAGYTFQAAPRKVLLGDAEAQTEDQNYAHMTVTAEQLLYDFGRSGARVDAMQSQAEAAASNLVSREQDLFLNITQTYFRVLAAEQLLQSAEEEVTQVEAHRNEAKALYEEGVVTRNDLLQAAVRLASSRQQQMVQAGVLDNAWFALNYLTGRPAEARDKLSAQMDDNISIDLEESQLDRRPELLAQQQRVAAASAGVEENRSIFRPELYARLGADYTENSYVKDQTIYQATLGLRVNLFDGQANSSQLRQSLLALDREKLRLDDLRARTELEYRQARNDARVARQRIEVAAAAILQAEENLRINRERYREQVGTATEVLDAQTLLTQSRSDLALAQYDHHVAVARVQRIAGKL
jgi:outer membrane protein